METETKLTSKEILARLAKLQAEVDYLKKHVDNDSKEEVVVDSELREEMKEWEQAGVDDLLR